MYFLVNDFQPVAGVAKPRVQLPVASGVGPWFPVLLEKVGRSLPAPAPTGSRQHPSAAVHRAQHRAQCRTACMSKANF